jgi:RNA polymerase sigma-70 factor (ECF subfamily)
MDIESRMRLLADENDFRGAASIAIESYGPEVLGFLVHFLHSEHDARDAFSQTCEDMWKGLRCFEWQSSFRTWFYVLARHAASRSRHARNRHAERDASISKASEIAARTRSATPAHERTDVKDGFAALRAMLDVEDRMLLVLRIDRGMSWSDVARIMSPEDATGDVIARTSARLRKRFQTLKSEIRALARGSGLLPEHD